MAVNQVSFTSPGYDYGADISAIERRRRMAEMLQQQAAQPMEQAPVAPGQFAVPISPWQGVAKLAQAWASKRQGDKAEEQQRELSTKAQKDLADVLRRGQLAAAGTPGTPLSEDASGNVTPPQPAVPGDPSKAAAAYLSHPTTMQMGMTIQQQELEKQRRAQMMKDIMEMGAQKGATAGGPWSPDFAAQQAQGGNPLASVPPQALALMLSGDKELASLGGKLHEGTQGTGRVYFDEKQRAYTLNKNNQRVDVPALRGLTPAEEQRIPMERSRLWWETGQSPSPLGAPGAPQQPPMAQAPQGAPAPAVAPSAGSPLNVPPKDRAKLELERPQAAFAARSVLDGMSRAEAQIDKLLANQPGVSGITGPIAGRLPSGKGASTNAQADLDTLKSMMSVQELQRMRDASKTGGAVGNVTEKEWPRLEAQWAALQQTQTTDEFRRKLGELRHTMRTMQQNTRKAYEDTYGKFDYTPKAGSDNNDPLGIRGR